MGAGVVINLSDHCASTRLNMLGGKFALTNDIRLQLAYACSKGTPNNTYKIGKTCIVSSYQSSNPGCSDSTMMEAATFKKRRNCQAFTSVYVPKRDIKQL